MPTGVQTTGQTPCARIDHFKQFFGLDLTKMSPAGACCAHIQLRQTLRVAGSRRVKSLPRVRERFGRSRLDGEKRLTLGHGRPMSCGRRMAASDRSSPARGRGRQGLESALRRSGNHPGRSFYPRARGEQITPRCAKRRSPLPSNSRKRHAICSRRGGRQLRAVLDLDEDGRNGVVTAPVTVAFATLSGSSPHSLT